MTYVTRDLLSLALSRNAGESVTLQIKTYAAAGDGSYTATTVPVTVLARVVDLQPSEIQRLMEKGITMHKGVSVAIPTEYTKAPYEVVRADGTILTVMDYTISENGTVLLCDMPALGAAAPVVGP